MKKAHIYTHIHVYTRIYTYIRVFTRIYADIHVYTCIYTHLRVYTCNTRIYVYIPVYTCICVYLRVYTATSTTKNMKNNGSRKGNDLTCSLGMCQTTARVALHTQNIAFPRRNWLVSKSAPSHYTRGIRREYVGNAHRTRRECIENT